MHIVEYINKGGYILGNIYRLEDIHIGENIRNVDTYRMRNTY